MKNVAINPIQPYFVLNTQNNYLKRAVNAGGIAHFYHFTADAVTDCINAVPDASIDIIFSLHPDNPKALVCGCHTTPSDTRLDSGYSYFGVRYQIGVTPDFLQLSPQVLVNQRIPLSEIVPYAEELLESIIRCRDFDAQINCFLRYCGQSSFSDSPTLCQALLQLMLNNRGDIRMEELATQTHYSVRTVNKHFTDFFGYSPKTFCSMLRYQNALKLITHEHFERLTDIAFELGYTDQSHFLRDFKRYNIQGPKQFKKALAQHDYQAHILHH